MKQVFYLILTALLLGGMYITNPNEEKLRSYLQKNRQKEAIEGGDLLNGLKDLVAGPESWLKSMTADRNNYYLFSIYKVHGLEKEQKYVGIFGTFFEMETN